MPEIIYQPSTYKRLNRKQVAREAWDAGRESGRQQGLAQIRGEMNEAEEKATNRYGIQPNAFAFRDQREQGVRSFYFGIVVEYAAAEHVTIQLGDIVKPRNLFEQEQKLELKNLEFALTRAIKKSIFGLESQRELFAKFPGKAVVTTYITPEDELPELFKEN